MSVLLPLILLPTGSRAPPPVILAVNAWKDVPAVLFSRLGLGFLRDMQPGLCMVVVGREAGDVAG